MNNFPVVVHPNAFRLFENHTSAQTNNQLKVSPGANRGLYVTDIIVSNGAQAGTMFLVQDTAGAATQISQTLYLPINGGACIHFNIPIRLSENVDLGFTSASVSTHSIEVHGFTNP